MTPLAARVSDLARHLAGRLARRVATGTRPSPRGLGVGALSVLGLAVLLVTVLVAAGVPLTRVLAGLPAGHAVDLELGEGHLPPFRVEGVRALLDPGAAERILGPGLRNDTGPGAPGSQPQSGPGPGGAPADPPRRGGLAPVLAPGSWVLTVEMAADRATVPPAEDIAYSITVRNVGADPFPGGTNFELQWHIPFGTVNSTPLACTPPGAPASLDDVCPPVAIPFPGLPTNSHGSMNSLGLIPIPPGGTFVREVRVTVGTSTTPNRVLLNHAHLDVTGDGLEAITSNEVAVVVVAPEAPNPGAPG